MVLDGIYLHLRENSTLSNKVYTIPVVYTDNEGMYCMNQLEINILLQMNITAIIKQVSQK